MSLQPALKLPLRLQKAKEQETKTCCIVAGSASDITDSHKARNQNYVHGCYLQLTDSLWSANSFCFFIITEFHERRHDV